MWALGASVPFRSALIASALASAGVLASRSIDPPALTEPAITYAIRIASPPPPPPPERRVVTAMLVSRPAAVPGCGVFLIETAMAFAHVHADSATLRVLVPCAEMPRPMFSRSAGDAGVLEVGHLYRLELTGPIDDGAGKNDDAWRAERIDLVPATHDNW